MCLSEDQCIEGYCCPFMRVCVKTPSTSCSGMTAQCTSYCWDDMDQSKCNCRDSFPEKWAKPTCGGKVCFISTGRKIIAAENFISFINKENYL